MNKSNKDLRENIILPAWNIIKNDGKIKKFYIIPGILSIIFLSGLLSYQAIYTYVKFFWESKEILQSILNFVEIKYIVEAVVFWVIFLLIYFILSPVFEAWLIKYLDLKNKWKELSKSEAFWQWIYKFLPMFEYNNFFSEFKLISIMNFYLFTIRFVWIEYIKVVNYTYLVILFFSIIINILFVYVKYFVIAENRWIFDSIGNSIKLSILNPKKTTKLFFMMFLLNFRIIINFIVFLFFPIFIAVAISLITSQFLLILAITIISIIFVSLILILWYLTAVLEIFKTALWYYAYLDSKKNAEDS